MLFMVMYVMFMLISSPCDVVVVVWPSVLCHESCRPVPYDMISLEFASFCIPKCISLVLETDYFVV